MVLRLFVAILTAGRHWVRTKAIRWNVPAKKVGTTRNLAATFLYQLCLGGEESGQSGTEKRVIHMRMAQFCTLVHDFYLDIF